jgi:hypothetical protein
VTLNAEYAALNASGPLPWAQRGSAWSFSNPYGHAQTPPQSMHAAPVGFGYFSGVTVNTESATLNAGRNLQTALAGEWDPSGLYLRAQTPPKPVRAPSAGYESVAQPKAEYAMHADPAGSSAVHPSPQALQERRPSTPHQPFGERLPILRATTPTADSEGVVQPIALRSARGDAQASPPRLAGATTIGSSTSSPPAFNDRPRVGSPFKPVAISPTR